MLTAKRLQDILRKFSAIGSKPTLESFPGLEDCILWMRFLLAIGFGMYLGPTAGALGFMYGLNIITFLPILYCQLLLLADLDSFKNLHFVGVPNALAMMLLVWIFGFTRQYSAEELKLASAVVLQQILPPQDPHDSSNGVSTTAPPVDLISTETAMPTGEHVSMTSASDAEF